MKKFTHRLLPLVLCFTLTLGAFAYRPPEAKAVAGVDDAVVIGALLTAFAGGMGLIFSNNGMTGSQIADGMARKWEEYKETLANPPAHFSEWLGYEDNDALMMDMVLQGDALAVPRAVARKFAEFADWLKSDPDVVAGGSSTVVATGVAYYISQFSTSVWNLADDSIGLKKRYLIDVYNPSDFPCHLAIENAYGFNSSYPDVGTFFIMSNKPFTILSVVSDMEHEAYGSLTRGVYLVGDSRFTVYCFPFPRNSVDSRCFTVGSGSNRAIRLGDYGVSSEEDGAFVFTQNPDIAAPDIDDEKDTPVGVTGVGDGTATTIEDLLQQILAQVEANTLAPTLEGVDTDTGGDTGTDTDEDAKPYLPYIPRIFEKIGELPSLIAEKIGAFFTTLWGWLQNIIDAIKAIPSAIAEAVGTLFKPDEALVTEITDTFKEKFGFLPTLKRFGDDLFGMTAETEPPVVWIHLENAESKYGYIYGDKTKALDLTWYQKYKANVDTIVSGFLWLAFLWLLFKRASSIIQGGEMIEQYTTDISAGHREKGGKKK